MELSVPDFGFMDAEYDEKSEKVTLSVPLSGSNRPETNTLARS